jgi:hypothetical protein
MRRRGVVSTWYGLATGLWADSRVSGAATGGSLRNLIIEFFGLRMSAERQWRLFADILKDERVK